MISLQDASFSYGGPPLFEGVTFSVEPGRRLALVGRNGTGKSTLLRLIRGELQPTAGRRTQSPQCRIAELPQQAARGLAGTVRGVVAGGLPEWGERLERYHRRVHDLAAQAGAAELAAVEREQRELERLGGFSLEAQVDRVLSRVGLDPELEAATLSVGFKRRVLLARALVGDPDVLVLDEPTNHLDVGGIEWLEDFLLRWQGALVFVSHDRAFTRRLATHVLHLERGRLKVYDDGYARYLEQLETDREAEASAQAVADRKLVREEAWAKQGVKARRTRAQARVRALEALRREKRERRQGPGPLRMQAAAAERSGNLVVAAEGVTFGYGDKPLVRDFTALITRGDKIGVIGPNGSGKTTLLRLLLGELTPAAGTVRHGVKLQVGYFDQVHATLDEGKSVAQNVCADDFVVLNGSKRHVIGYLQDFLFRAEQVRGSVRDLSGGERNRLLLARLFARPTNVLVLDEPTNDLDHETLEVLEELLADYPGTVLLVSHDREFLNRVVTSTLVLEGGGRVQEYAGGYDDYLRQRKPPEPEEADRNAGRKAPPRVREAARDESLPRRRTYGEQIELGKLPDAIAALEAERTAIHERMSDPAFYRGDPAEVPRATDRLAELDQELARAYARWEELEGLSA